MDYDFENLSRNIILVLAGKEILKHLDQEKKHFNSPMLHNVYRVLIVSYDCIQHAEPIEIVRQFGFINICYSQQQPPKKIPNLTITHTECPDEIFQLPKWWSGVTYSFWIHSNCKSEISNSLQSTDVATWDNLIQSAKGTIEEYEGIDGSHPITAPCDILRYLAEVIPEISSKLIVICGLKKIIFQHLDNNINRTFNTCNATLC